MKKNKCPICKKSAQEEKNTFQPFCSERCKKTDLGKWAMGDYRIPAEPFIKDISDETEKNGEEQDNVD